MVSKQDKSSFSWSAMLMRDLAPWSSACLQVDSMAALEAESQLYKAKIEEFIRQLSTLSSDLHLLQVSWVVPRILGKRCWVFTLNFPRNLHLSGGALVCGAERPTHLR